MNDGNNVGTADGMTQPENAAGGYTARDANTTPFPAAAAKPLPKATPETLAARTILAWDHMATAIGSLAAGREESDEIARNFKLASESCAEVSRQLAELNAQS